MLSGKRINVFFAATAASILLVKAIGFIRDIILGARLGTTGLADIYTQIFGIPGLLFAAAGVAVSSISIPVLVRYAGAAKRRKAAGESADVSEGKLGEEAGKYRIKASNQSFTGGKEARDRYVSAIMQSIVLITVVLSALMVIAAPVMAKLLLPGAASDPELLKKAVTLTRLMAPSLIFVCLAYITSGVLQVHGRFIRTSLISIPFNILIIGTLLISGQDVVLLGAVTTVGWALQFLVLLPALRAEKYSLSRMPAFGFREPEISALYKQLLPIMLGNAMLHICIITDKIFASGSQEGAAAALSYGSGLFMTITGVFTIAMSTVAFPELSKYCAEGDGAKTAGMLRYIFKTLIFIFAPYLIITGFFHSDLISLIYERGEFTAVSTAMSSEAFLFYSFCIAGYVFQEITGRMFCALKKFKIPMVLCVAFVSVNVALDFLLFGSYGIAGITASTAVAVSLYAVAAAVLIRKETGKAVADRTFVLFILRTAVPVAGMAAFFALYRMSGIGFETQKGFFIIPVILGCLIYAGVSWATGALREVRRSWIFS